MVCVYTDYFKKKGCQPYVLTNFRMEREYPLPDGVERTVIGEKIQETSSRVHNYIQRLKVIREECRTNQIGIAVVFARANAIRFLLATLGLRIKIVVAIRISPEREFPGGIASFLAKKIIGRADGYLFQTKEQRDFFGRRIAERSIVLPNSIAESFLRAPYQGKRDNRIVAVGRLAHQKNHSMLIRAFAEIAEKYTDTRLVIYGEGGLRESLEKEVDELNLSDRVELPGEVSKIAEHIQSAKLFVLPSDYEGMPNALIEAMSLGMPVIATDCPCGGPAELIQNGENGILIPVGDKERLKSAIVLLLRDEELRKKIGANARKIQEQCSSEKTSEQFYGYLERLCRKTGSC